MAKVQIPNFERNLDWNLLKVFHEIVRMEGVSRAAVKLARQQPAVSGALKRLEDCVGATLCRRGPKGFELTDEGELVAAVARRMFGAVEELPGRLEDAGAEPSGEIRITMVQNLVSPTLDSTLSSFSRLHPQVEIIINIAFLPDLENLVANGRVEIGIAPVAASKPDLRYDFLYREQHRPFCGRGHPLYGFTFEDSADLADEVFILPDIEEAAVIHEFRRRHGWGRRFAGRSPHLTEVRRLVAGGLGIGFMPEEMLHADIADGTLWPLMPPQEDAQADVLVISNPSAPRSLATRRFLTSLDVSRSSQSDAVLQG